MFCFFHGNFTILLPFGAFAASVTISLKSAFISPLLIPQFPSVQQDVPARMNASSTSAPVPAQETIHNKMEELEEQILSKILALEKDHSSVTSNNDQQQDVDKELEALQSRITNLEHGQSWQEKKMPIYFSLSHISFLGIYISCGIFRWKSL